jgi:hypothetical protein
MRNSLIKIFYNEKQVLENNSSLNFSKSPLKPKLLIEYLRSTNLLSNFSITKNFNIFGNADFKLAHTDNYVDNTLVELASQLCDEFGGDMIFHDVLEYLIDNGYESVIKDFFIDTHNNYCSK